jgi:transcriptional regulator GlxA family with amidase domain
MAGIYRILAFLPLDARTACWKAGRMNAEILLFDGFDDLDVIAPWEVLSETMGGHGVAASLVTLEGAREVTSSHGVVMRAHGALSERPDVLIVPGGGWMDRAPEGAWSQSQRGDIPAAIAARHAAGTTVASVCTGALLLAAAGILNGRRATTNPSSLDDLRTYSEVDVVVARLVDDGDVITAGAPACGLDLGILLAERVGGPELAEAAARELQYERPSDRPGLQPVGQGA